MNLDEAIQAYRRHTASGLLRPDEFPVMTFEGEYYVVRCAARVADTSPLWLAFHGPERHVNYLSLASYMQTAADGFDDAVVILDESGALHETDALRLRTIHRDRNPGASFPYASK